MNQSFLNSLRKHQWKEISIDWEYKKGPWVIKRDTGSWWMITNSETAYRGFDFPEPTDTTAQWTVNLIEHLCNFYENAGR